MFERSHHRRVEQVIRLLRSRFLEQNGAFFGGGTSIALQIREYRESVDVDFLCNDASGYRQIQQAVFAKGHDAVMSCHRLTLSRMNMTSPPKVLRPLPRAG